MWPCPGMLLREFWTTMWKFANITITLDITLTITATLTTTIDITNIKLQL